jgi:hypothetical protein
MDYCYLASRSANVYEHYHLTVRSPSSTTKLWQIEEAGSKGFHYYWTLRSKRLKEYSIEVRAIGSVSIQAKGSNEECFKLSKVFAMH